MGYPNEPFQFYVDIYFPYDPGIYPVGPTFLHAVCSCVSSGEDFSAWVSQMVISHICIWVPYAIPTFSACSPPLYPLFVPLSPLDHVGPCASLPSVLPDHSVCPLRHTPPIRSYLSSSCPLLPFLILCCIWFYCYFYPSPSPPFACPLLVSPAALCIFLQAL